MSYQELNRHFQISLLYNIKEPEEVLEKLNLKNSDEFFEWLAKEFRSKKLDWREIWVWSPYPNALPKVIKTMEEYSHKDINNFMFQYIDQLTDDQIKQIAENYFILFKKPELAMWYDIKQYFLRKFKYACKNYVFEEKYNKIYSEYKIEYIKRKWEQKKENKNIELSRERKRFERKISKLNNEIESYEKFKNREIEIFNLSMKPLNERMEIIAYSNNSLIYYPDRFFRLSYRNLESLSREILEKLYSKTKNMGHKSFKNKNLKQFVKNLHSILWKQSE